MPAYNYIAHEELSPYLEKYPSLFGFYSDGSNAEDWIKDTGMLNQPYRHSSAYFFARFHETPPSSPSTAKSSTSYYEPQTFYFSDSESDSNHDQRAEVSERSSPRKSKQAERCWLYKNHSPSHADTYRTKGRYFDKNHIDDYTRSRISLNGRYDFSQLDSLFVNLASLLQSCLVHVSSPGRSLPKSPNPLPERLLHPLTSFHGHIGLEDSTILPRKGSTHQRWYPPSHPFQVTKQATTARAPMFDGRRFPSPLGSHPPASDRNQKINEFRTLQLLSKTTGGKRHLLPSIIALLIARSLILALLAILSRRRLEKFPEFSSYYSSSRVLKPYGVPSKASELLGLPHVDLKAFSVHQSAKCIKNDQGQARGARSSRRFSCASNLSTRDMNRQEEPGSKWSPWSQASLSSFFSSSDISNPPECAEGPSSRSSYSPVPSMDEFERRITKLCELEKITERLLRTVGLWTWGCAIRSGAGGRDTWVSEVDAKIENSYKLLIQEGFFRRA